MSENTKIEWCDSTWSPWRGCTKVSSGCANCYAETLSKRNPAVFGEWGKDKPRVINKNWDQPVKWNKHGVCVNCGFVQSRTGTKPHQTKGGSGVCGQPKDGRIVQTFRRPRVFPSLCDWLDEEVPIEWLARFLKLIHDTPNLDWLLLTKRPELFRQRMLEAQCRWQDNGATWAAIEAFQWIESWINGNPPSNVWIGTSVEDQQNADRRIPALLEIPAKLRFLSVEPMLGPVDLAYTCFNGSDSFGSMPGIGWVIVGGESGPGARACNVDWIRDIVRQCAAAGVPCFVKQLGAHVCTDNANMDDWPEDTTLIGEGEGFAAARAILKHPKGGDPAEWPEDLRVRQMPAA